MKSVDDGRIGPDGALFVRDIFAVADCASATVSLVNSQISTPNCSSTSRLRRAAASGIRCCSIGFSCGSTIELPLKAPIGSVIPSGSIRNRMPMVGRLRGDGKADAGLVQLPHRALWRASVRILSLVSSVPSTSETTSAMRVMGGSCCRSLSAVAQLATMSSTIASTEASIETVDRMFVRLRRLQGLELAVEQARRHEMILAPGEPVGDQVLRAVEKDDADIVSSVHEDIAIGALQRRAGDHDMLAGLADPVDLVGNRLQPRPAVFIGQRMAGAHLGDIACGMKACRRPRRSSPVVRPIRSAMVLLPEPDTPITISAQGDLSGLSATKFSASRGAVDEQARFRRSIAPDWPAGSRLREAASRSHAFPRPRPRTASRGRRRARAKSGSPAARRARHGLWARRRPSVWSRSIAG